jgi:hypothetical protein
VAWDFRLRAQEKLAGSLAVVARVVLFSSRRSFAGLPRDERSADVAELAEGRAAGKRPKRSSSFRQSDAVENTVYTQCVR